MPPVHKQNTNTEKNLRVIHLCEVACELALVICKITGGVFDTLNDKKVVCFAVSLVL